MKAKAKTIYGWLSLSAFCLVFGFLLTTSNLVRADKLRTNVPTKLTGPPAELVPVKPAELVPSPIVPVVVPEKVVETPPKTECRLVPEKRSVSYEPGISVSVPGMLVNAPSCNCCGAEATWLNGASFSTSSQKNTSTFMQLVCN